MERSLLCELCVNLCVLCGQPSTSSGTNLRWAQALREHNVPQRFFTMVTMLSCKSRRSELLQRTEITEPHRIQLNTTPLRKTQNVSFSKNNSLAFDKLKHPQYVGSGGKMIRIAANSSTPIAIGTCLQLLFSQTDLSRKDVSFPQQRLARKPHSADIGRREELQQKRGRRQFNFR